MWRGLRWIHSASNLHSRASRGRLSEYAIVLEYEFMAVLYDVAHHETFLRALQKGTKTGLYKWLGHRRHSKSRQNWWENFLSTVNVIKTRGFTPKTTGAQLENASGVSQIESSPQSRPMSATRIRKNPVRSMLMQPHFVGCLWRPHIVRHKILFTTKITFVKNSPRN